MALDIIWSPKALQNFHSVIAYLEENWNEQVVKDFVARTEAIIKTIAINPQLFRKISTNNPIREAVITKHNLLLYKTSENTIILVAIFDTRQHPRKKIQ